MVMEIVMQRHSILSCFISKRIGARDNTRWNLAQRYKIDVKVVPLRAFSNYERKQPLIRQSKEYICRQ